MTARLAGALLLTALVTACATPGAPPSGNATAAVTASARAYQQSIELAGRLSVQYQRNGQDQALHGSFTWLQTGQRTRLSLLSPLGQTLAVIEVEPGQATLTQAGQPARMAPDADTLVATTLGWPLPVEGLHDWLQGFAIDAHGQRWTAPADEAATVQTQTGWQITYASWENNERPGMSARPRRIDLTRVTPQAGTVAIRLVIDHWHPL